MLKEKKIKIIVIAVVVFAAVAVLFWAYAVQIRIPCPFFRLTGLYCPSCGATGAVISLLHGDIAGAFRYNAFFTVMIVPMLILMIRFAIGYISGKSELFKLKKITLWIIFAIIILFFVFGIVRNIPVPPFTYLAVR